MMPSQFRGCITALVTPLRDGKVDIKTFQNLANRQLEAGAHGIVVNGTTGESPTTSEKEKESLIKAALEVCKNKIPVLVGTGSNCTEKTITDSKQAEKLGADALLIVAPYYNKPTQEGLYQHYKAINDQVNIPIILYNVPGRVVVNLADETIFKLAMLKNIMGIKDSTGDLTRPTTLRSKLPSTKFASLTGEDPSMVAFNAAGGDGVICAVSNVIPRECVEIQNLCMQNNYPEAARKHSQIIEFILSLFCETNPVPVKYALSQLGLTTAEVRLPLVELTEGSKARINKAMQALNMV